MINGGDSRSWGRLLKPVLSILLATILLSPVVWTPAASGKESWVANSKDRKDISFQIDPASGNQLISIEESTRPKMTAVGMGFLDPSDEIDRPPTVAICEEIGKNLDCNVDVTNDPGSDKSSGSLKMPVIDGGSILPMCDAVLENCIEALHLRPEGAVAFAKAKFQRYSPGPRFLGDPELGIPTGTGLSIFSSEAQHTGGGEYSVNASIEFRVKERKQAGLVRLRSFSLEVFGTKSTANEEAKVPSLRIYSRGEGRKDLNAAGVPFECAYSGDGYCGVIHDLNLLTEIKVTLILSNQLTGWLRGRIQQGTFEVSRLNEMYSRVTVSGKPADVPKILSSHSISRGDADVVGDRAENSYRGDVTLVDSASDKAMAVVQALKEPAEDTATAITPTWSLKSLPESQDSEYRACSSRHPGLVGVVSTNAMAFDGEPPIFGDGYFSYNVSGMHYRPDGITPLQGTYDLSIRSDFARCLYGYSNAPISATVSVLGEQGQENIATEVVSERNGWLNLSARGFTFSEKELQVRIGQSQIRTLDAFSGSRTSLTSRQKSQIRSVVEKSKGNAKFICTGIRYYQQPMSVNVMVRKRAKEACEYAKSLNPNFSFWFQTKPTKARSYAGKVLLVSKN